jgi:hypothetical protein
MFVRNVGINLPQAVKSQITITSTPTSVRTSDRMLLVHTRILICFIPFSFAYLLCIMALNPAIINFASRVDWFVSFSI